MQHYFTIGFVSCNDHSTAGYCYSTLFYDLFLNELIRVVCNSVFILLQVLGVVWEEEGWPFEHSPAVAHSGRGRPVVSTDLAPAPIRMQ